MEVGSSFGRYRLDELLGEGGFGQVFGAFDTVLHRKVALKILRAEKISDEGRARLVREARVAAGLEHPNIVRIYDVGEHEGTPFIAMERLRGYSLRDAIGDASIAVGTKIRWLVEIARALAVAHEHGLVHRDVKPDNIHIGTDGVVRVLDFGIARAASDRPDHARNLGTITEKGVVIGTPAYMAPEQVRDDRVDAKSDQFSWGVVAYELLTGRIPWQGEGVSIIANILATDPPTLSVEGLGDEVARVVMTALAKDPQKRFASLDAAVAILAPGASSNVAIDSSKRVGRAFEPTQPIVTPTRAKNRWRQEPGPRQSSGGGGFM